MLLGFDIGGTKIAVVAGTLDGKILARREIATSTPEQCRERFIRLGQELCDEFKHDRLTACGISAPGPMSSKLGMLLNPPNMLSWVNTPVKCWVEEAFQVPTAMENDANAAALAEWSWGFDCKIDNLIYLTCGTGMGAGLILDGHLYRGKQDLAGEIGHVRLRPFGLVGFYKAGSVEGFTSAYSLGRLAVLRREESHVSSPLDGLDVREVTGKVVGDAALAGDPFAVACVRESASLLGEFVGNLIDTLNPERVSLGSMAVRLGSLYVDEVKRVAGLEAIPTAFDNCVIDKAILGEEVQDLAALAVAQACQSRLP